MKLDITSHLKLPFNFIVEKLKKDLAIISSSQWNPQIYKMNYKGQWTSIALLSKNGDKDNFAHANSTEEIKDTEILKKCLYFKEVISAFKCPLISARLLKLSAKSEIKPHRDYRLGYENNNFRIHIPIVTNSEVAFILNGNKLEMSPGECWYTNVNFIHSVINRSSEDRVHLVIDCERNDWSDQLFFSLAPKESFNLMDDKFLIESKKRTIEELKIKKDPKLNQLIQELENELMILQN